MILADGATLQSGKYVIQSVLHRTDLGITYQAYHVFLDQTVVLQTLNPKAKQAKDPQVWQQIVQHFMSGARHLAKHPSNHRLRAIDLFEEQIEGQNLPFVVLSFLPNQSPQKLGEWFVHLPEPTPAKATLPQTKVEISEQPQTLAANAAANPEKVGSVQAQPAPAPASIAVEAKSVEPENVELKGGEQKSGEAKGTLNGSTPNGAIPQEALPLALASDPVTATQPVVAAAQSSQVLNGRSSQKTSSTSVRVFVQPRRRSPNAFLLTALIAGAVGAGMGFALRVHPAPQGKAPFSFGTGLFTREQSFPAEGNWPIHETPAVMQPEPTEKQPTYSAEPALQYTPPAESFPNNSYAPLPSAPAQSTPSTVAPSDTSEPVPQVDRTLTVPPASNAAPPISREPAQTFNPAPAAPAPAVAEPPPLAPPAPAVEPAPAAPAPPPATARPKTIDQ